jgi:hypothetical protein
MRPGELHIQLSVNFPDNRKVRALNRYGREARPTRDLYVQMLLYCKENKSDGQVPAEQIGLLCYPDPEATGKRQAGYLVAVGLCEQGDEDYRVTGWLERNPSREDIERKSEAKARGARLANHRRWHAEMDSPDPECEWCQKEENQTTDQTTDLNSDQTTDQKRDQNGVTSRIGAAKRSDSTETESETESEVKTLGRQAGRQIEPGSDEDPDFCAFWIAYPKHTAKGQARKTWKTLVTKKHIDPKTLILAAERYRDDPRRPQDRQYVPNPSTWLNGEYWLEQQDDDRDDDDGPGDDEDFWSS